MRKLAEAQRSRLAANQEAVLKDTGQVLAFSQVVGSDYRQANATYTAGAAISVGYSPSGPNEVHEDQEVAILAGRVRLPLGTAVTSKDRIRITHIGGQELATALTFAVYGPPMVRPTVTICNLAKITDGS